MACGTLTLLAGPNGAGKSTLVKSLSLSGGLADHIILNADDRTLEKAKLAGHAGFADTPMDSLAIFFSQAADEVLAEAVNLIHAGRKVSLETVLSTDKYQSVVTDVLEGGGKFELIYVALQSPDISRQRVALRVQKGGHDVPADRLQARWTRSLEKLKWFAPKATRFSIYDNSSHPAVFLATGENGRMQWQIAPENVFPEMRALLEDAFKNSQ